MNLFTSFIFIIFFAIISTITANPNDLAPPRLVPLLAPQASSTGMDCTSLMYDMASCISFLTIGSKATNPDPECCSRFVKVLKTDAGCVCEALKTTAKLGFDIDMERVAALPSACNTKSSSIDSCYMSDAPRTSPVTAPATSPVMAPTISPVTPPVSDAPHSSPVTAPSISSVTSPVPAPSISLDSSPVIAPDISPDYNPITAPAISPATSPVTAPTISQVTAPASSPQTTPNFLESPSPAPIVAPNSAAPVPQANFVSAKSPTPAPYISPMSSTSSTPAQAPTNQRVTQRAPAPAPAHANAYAIASSSKCLFSMLLASFLYMLISLKI